MNDDFTINTIKGMIEIIGDDPSREGLKDTPRRVIKSWDHLYSGYEWDEQKIEAMLTQFGSEAYSELIILDNIEFFSTCEHHMLPFYGIAHIGYIPYEKIAGISKLARLLEIYSRRLQIQERICYQVTDAIMKYLSAKGAVCILEGKHMCLACRGVEKTTAVMITSSMVGCMKELACRQEFLSLIRR